ncbi:hypothetical protein Ancab_035301 [Ancistrocladus abbreviatus]
MRRKPSYPALLNRILQKIRGSKGLGSSVTLDMAGLQRSAISFRRQGSSGLVWDDKFLSSEASDITDQPKSEGGEGCSTSRRERSSPAAELRRSKSDSGRHATYNHHHQRTVKVAQAEDPPSPKLSACGCCGVFSQAGSKPKGQHRKLAGKHQA